MENQSDLASNAGFDGTVSVQIRKQYFAGPRQYLAGLKRYLAGMRLGCDELIRFRKKNARNDESPTMAASAQNSKAMLGRTEARTLQYLQKSPNPTKNGRKWTNFDPSVNL